MLGVSVAGRPIYVVHRPNPKGPVMVIFGCIHGNESAGIDVARLVETLPMPVAVDLWIVEDLNPDGVAASTRQNADGVDLNRNFPYSWRLLGRRGDQQYSGTGPLSEPESRIAGDLLLKLKPKVTIWFHQPVDVVDDSGGDPAIERRYAHLSGMTERRLARYPGSAIGWQNATLAPTTAFAVELPAGQLGPADALRQANAVLNLIG